MADDEVPGAPGLPQREIRDPDVLRALAHPVRLQLLEELATDGPATATELAKRVGESQANCSWHLRQLHRFGFIEEVEDAKGRQRPWRFVMQSLKFDESDVPDPAETLAAEAVRDVMLEREVAFLKQWLSSNSPDSPWRKAAATTQNLMYLTLDELDAFAEDFKELIVRHVASRYERLDPDKRPPGARPVRVVGWAVPGGPDTESTPGSNPSPPDSPPAEHP